MKVEYILKLQGNMPCSDAHITSLKNKVLPDMDSQRRKKVGYRTHPIMLNNSVFNESLIDIRAYILGVNHYYRADNPPYFFRVPSAIPELWLRETVFRKLKRIDQKISAFGLKLFVYDAYRPVEVQNYFHDIWFPDYLSGVLGNDIQPQELLIEVEKFWARGAISSEGVDVFLLHPIQRAQRLIYVSVELIMKASSSAVFSMM